MIKKLVGCLGQATYVLIQVKFQRQQRKTSSKMLNKWLDVNLEFKIRCDVGTSSLSINWNPVFSFLRETLCKGKNL